MKLEIGNFTEVYKDILKDTYQCAILNEIFKNNILSEEEFIKLCLSDRRNICTWRELTQLANKDGKFNYGADLLEFLDFYFEKNFKTNYSLLLANMISMIEREDTRSSTLIHYFMDLNISKQSGLDYFLYFLHFIQHKIQMKTCIRDERMEKCIFELFMRKFNKFIEGENVKIITEIIGENYFRRFFLQYFDDYLERIRLHEYLLRENDLEEILLLFMNNFDTYEWLDKTRKDFLIDLGRFGKIFYKKYYDELDGEKKNHYLSEMTISLIKNNAIVV